MLTPTIALAALVGCHVVDGDTLRCGQERVRLLGIDAPEIHGCHPRGRICAPGDGQASKVALERIAGGQLRIRRVGADRYGRTLAVVYAGRVNLSCAQLRAGQAIYKLQWDDGGLVRRECPEVARR